jgi:hypothetical protein
MYADYHYDSDEDHYEPYVDNVLPPTGLPVGGNLKKLKALAVSDALWTDWPFSWDNGSMVSCEGCAGYYEDDTKEDFKKMIAKLKSLEKLQIVRTGDPPTLSRSPLNFR